MGFLYPFLGDQDCVQGTQQCLGSAGLVAEWAEEYALPVALLQIPW